MKTFTKGKFGIQFSFGERIYEVSKNVVIGVDDPCHKYATSFRVEGEFEVSTHISPLLNLKVIRIVDVKTGFDMSLHVKSDYIISEDMESLVKAINEYR